MGQKMGHFRIYRNAPAPFRKCPRRQLGRGLKKLNRLRSGVRIVQRERCPQPFLDGSVKRCNRRERRKRIGSSSSPRLKERLRPGLDAAGMDCHRSLGCLRMAW